VKEAGTNTENNGDKRGRKVVKKFVFNMRDFRRELENMTEESNSSREL